MYHLNRIKYFFLGHWYDTHQEIILNISTFHVYRCKNKVPSRFVLTWCTFQTLRIHKIYSEHWTLKCATYVVCLDDTYLISDYWQLSFHCQFRSLHARSWAASHKERENNRDVTPCLCSPQTVWDSSHPIFSRPYEGRDGSCFTFVNVSFSFLFCMCYFLFTVSLHKAACRELWAQISQTSSRWHFCFFKVKSRRLPHEECVPSRSSHGTIEERGEERVEKGL